MGRNGDEALDSDEIPTTEPQLHRWDGVDPDAAAYDVLEVLPRPDDSPDVIDFPSN